MSGKFTAVVRLNPPSDKWSYFDELPKEIMAISRGSALIGIGKGKSCTNINRSKNIALEPGSEDRDGVHLDEVDGTLRNKAFPPCLLLGCLMLPYHQFTGPAIDTDLA